MHCCRALSFIYFGYAQLEDPNAPKNDYSQHFVDTGARLRRRSCLKRAIFDDPPKHQVFPLIIASKLSSFLLSAKIAHSFYIMIGDSLSLAGKRPQNFVRDATMEDRFTE